MPKEVFYYFNRNSKTSTVDQFSSRTLLNLVGAKKQYKVNDSWQDEPPGQKPDDLRMVIPTLMDYEKGRKTYNAWEQLQKIKSKEKPIFPEKILERMANAKTDNPLVLFVPWGVRISGNFGAKEDAAMDAIDSVRNLLDQNSIANTVLIMPADVYAIDINGMPVDKTLSYFKMLAEQAEERGYETVPWSQLRQNYWQDYSVLSAQYTDATLSTTLSPYVLEGAFKAASKKSNSNPQIAAYDYLRERMCEAEILEQRFTPIKLSMVDKRKDNEVDKNLPRLYALDEQLKFPWL